ncbi:Transcription factor bHLH25 [Spatholobus suberectus]|nr:Transcription factor bHLH25 [Spatholobus suberectus]
MDESWEKWLSDLEMDECHLFNEHDINSLEEELQGENSEQPKLSWESLSCDSNFTSAATNMGNSSSLEENTQHASYDKPNFSSYILSFEDSTAAPNAPIKTCRYHGEREHSKETQEASNTRKSKRDRNTSQTQDHIIAERKRRENITSMFIALSAIIPGLKKMDKLSILNNTIDHVKYLRNRVKDLEEENKKRKIHFVTGSENNKSNVTAVGDDFSEISDGLDRPNKTFPKVEAHVSAKDVLIRVICDKRKGIVTKLLSILAAHNLSIVSSNVLPFGNSTLNISVIAKVDGEFSTTMNDLVKNLDEDLLKCCNLQQ